MPSSPSAHQYPALDGASVSGTTYHTLAFANSSTKHVYYTYYNPNTYNWSTPGNMSQIIPGSNYTHSTPTLSVIPNSTKVHLAWYSKYGSGSSSYDHVIVHRKSTGYSTWPNEYHLTYYEGQRRPSISALTDNKVHLLFQHYNHNLVYKSSFNGSYWGGPVSVSSHGQHPSVSSGQSSARYVWTEGLNSPYEIKLSTEQLSKEAVTDKRDFYSRSIAWLDSSGNYLELWVNKMSLKGKDHSVRRLDFMNVSLDTFDLKPANSWDLLTSGAEYFPADAEIMLVSFTLIAENRDKVAEEGEQKAFVAIRLLTDTGQLLQSKQAETLSRDQSTETTPYTCAVALDEVKSALASVKIKVNTRVENLSAKEETFASLGHIYDFRKTADDEDESIKLAKTVSLTPVDEYMLYPNYPNPCNPSTTIRYALPEQAYVELAVYDIQGRLIQRLASGVREAGQHEAQWDGRDANGRAAASGVYLYSLSTDQGFTQTRKLLLLK